MELIHVWVYVYVYSAAKTSTKGKSQKEEQRAKVLHVHVHVQYTYVATVLYSLRCIAQVRVATVYRQAVVKLSVEHRLVAFN